MKMIRIEKYVDGTQQEQLSIPAGVLRVFAPLLPAEARRQLLAHGLDLDALLTDAGPAPAEQWLDVREGGVEKRVRITLS